LSTSNKDYDDDDDDDDDDDQPLLEYSSHKAGLRQITYAAYIRN